MLRRLSGDTYEVEVEHPDGTRERLTARLHGDLLETPYGLYPLHPRRPSRRPRGGRGGHPGLPDWLVEAHRGAIRARLPLRVVEARAQPGDTVEQGETLLVLETMKMLVEVPAPCSGTVEEIASPGPAAQGQTLARIRCSGA